MVHFGAVYCEGIINTRRKLQQSNELLSNYPSWRERFISRTLLLDI
ncbi:hypothetical protein [Anaplasma phagocytophilum]|nr:hypothetical protein [Anaplasma phagocytophilum]